MNPTLLAREQAAERGALDPKPEPAIVFQGPTRLIRVVDESEHVEIWIDPLTGRKVEDENR
jgi:hypothetical protein